MSDPKKSNSGKPTPLNEGFQPTRAASTQKGYQVAPARNPTSVEGGYQGPTSQGAPSNPPSGGSSGGSSKK